jgi:hypothetical protein
MLDAYPKWDPLAKYGIKMPGTAIIPVAAPIAAIPTGTARTTKFTSWSDPNLGMVAVNPGSFSPFVRYSPFVRRLFNNVNVHFHDIETDPTAKGSFQYKRITFGIMPSRSDFDIAFNNKVALVNKQYYYLDLSKLMSNLRLLHYNQIVTGNYRVNELYDLLEKLTTSNDPYQFRLAGSILFTLGFEWP